MKIKFSKIAAIAATTLIAGMTVGHAAALSPSDNAFNAVVYGAQADSADKTSADSIAGWLGLSGGTTSTTTVGGEGETEDKVILGGNVAIGEFVSALTDTDITSLLDMKISFDDGNGADDLDIHETITLGTTGLKVQTSADDNDYTDTSIEIEDGDFAYSYVFDDAINRTGISSSNTITLTILGQEMEFQDITNSSVTVSLAPDKSMTVGGTYTDSETGKTVTINGIFSASVGVSVDGVEKIVTESAGSSTINGLKVDVTGIGYNSNAPETSIAILKIGKDITKTYTDGDAFIGEPDDETRMWDWDISSTGGLDSAAKPSIGITNHRDFNAPNEDVIAVGGSYIMPNDFAELKFDSMTAAIYEEVTIDFDTSVDLKWDNGTTKINNAKAVVITGADSETFRFNSSIESNKIYVAYVDVINNVSSTYEVYYYDKDDNRPEYVGAGLGDASAFDIGDFIHDETTMALDFRNTGSNLTNSTITFSEDTTITEGHDVKIVVAGSSDFEYLGATDDTAEVGDIYGGLTATTPIGTKDNDVMDYYGTIIETPETNTGSDKVVLSIPGEVVYAQVSVLTGITTGSTTTGSMVFTDAEKASWANKNVVLVGGSCINTATATALGVSAGTCDVAFSDATNVGTGQYIIKTVGDAFTTGKLAMVVAGYTKEDTTAAATYLRTNGDEIDATAGQGYFGNVGVGVESIVTTL
jgi:hypothetical protein